MVTLQMNVVMLNKSIIIIVQKQNIIIQNRSTMIHFTINNNTETHTLTTTLKHIATLTINNIHVSHKQLMTQIHACRLKAVFKLC